MILLVLALILAWLLIAVLCWAFYQLLGQHGSVLIRLEALEAAMANAPVGTMAGGYDTLPIGSVAPDLGFPVGTVLQDFALPDLDGTMMRLSQWSGRRLLLIFFDPACGFCRLLLPELTSLSPDSDPLPIIITMGDHGQNRQLFAEHRVTVPVLLQQDGDVSAIYHIPGTPAGYLVDASGATAAPIALGAEAVMALAGAAPHADSWPAQAVKVTPSNSESRLIRDGLPKGTVAPPFHLSRIDGQELSLEDYRGRRVLLVFSDPGCAPCQVIAPDLERIHRARSNMAVLMISRNGVEANQAKAVEHDLTFPIVLQRHWEISRLYGMFATPIAYLIDESGIIADDVAVGGEAILALAGATAVPQHALSHR